MSRSPTRARASIDATTGEVLALTEQGVTKLTNDGAAIDRTPTFDCCRFPATIRFRISLWCRAPYSAGGGRGAPTGSYCTGSQAGCGRTRLAMTCGGPHSARDHR
jgi:hypothetical protein